MFGVLLLCVVLAFIATILLASGDAPSCGDCCESKCQCFDEDC